ncbi:OOP family OmpA-OmpF porin [Marinirhabdus gelatinilytica]|uniref:OOP family OmpA-OmpF porin n=2 Tax=Marinirhabdus gelatinilytica TaxID=1703343 RepID=A0A370QA65_9FLAO|nr:OOP family OmpA-OmpF porin [Marinirhabdus gelatinilytica]
MKKVTLVLTALFATVALYAQEESEIQLNEYNKWSIELSGGLLKPSSPFADGYSVNSIAPYQASLGVRYMMNEKFGVRANLGYASISEEDNSLPFETSYYRGTLEGVVNLGNLLEFSDWTETFGLLVHGGGGYSVINHEEPFELDEKDTTFNLMLGLTPQVRLSDRIALFADVSIIPNIGMERSWDGIEVIQTANRRIDDGLLYQVSAGINIYLGSESKHADWYSEKSVLLSKVEELEGRLAKVETDLIDSDQDGVPDYLDREPNTVSGVAVNTKGIAVDQNNNGIPDELEPSLDNRYVNESDYVVGGQGSGLNVEELLNKGYVNVYFKFNSTTPETYSLEAINYLIKYMKENPSANAELIGYADEIGNPSYNQTLSEKRANKVKDILVAAGIAQNRLTVTGNGEDASVEKSSAPARQLVRRVTFRLK